MAISEQLAVAATFYFRKVFISMKLIVQTLVVCGAFAPGCFWFSFRDNVFSKKNQLKER